MTTEAKIGYGTLLKIESRDSPNQMKVVGELTSVSMPAISRDAIDVTHMQSLEKWREFIAGLKDGGEVSGDLNFVPGSDGTTRLMAELAQDEVTSCEISIPTTPAYKWTFDAILTGFEPGDAPVDDKMAGTVTFKVTGKPTLALA